jgi:hypothetical protein
MLNNLKNILIGVFSAIIVIAVGASAYTALASPGGGESAGQAEAEEASNDYNGNGNGAGSSLLDIPASDLSPEEASALLFMREEEKLAHDVYNTLHTIWGQPTFSNIAASEQAHMDEVKVLLDRYGLADPALEPGSFSNPNLQTLYDQLVAQGSVSLAEALKVGAAIEEIDILDLQERLAQTDNADIQRVFNNLMTGSYNHLNAFVSTLQNQTGEIYQPQYLSAEAYAAILDGDTGDGNGNQGSSGYGDQGATGNGSQGATGNGQGAYSGNGFRGGRNSVSSGNGANGQGAQANIATPVTLNGTISVYDQASMTVLTSDGGTVVVGLGNAQYAQSIGFYPQIGGAATVVGYYDTQGLFSAINVTINGQTYAFRDETGRALWSGGKGNGRGDNR